MHKKTTLFLTLSLILVLSILSNVNTQSASAQSTTNPSGVSMIGLQLQLMQPNKNYYSPVNTSLLPQVQNQTEARFIASFVNQNTSSATLQNFKIYFFNSSAPQIPPDNIVTYTYDQNSPARIQIPVNGTYTEVFQHQIPFHLLDQAYTIQYQFNYVLASNTSLTLTLNSPFNFSLQSQLPLYSPPQFIIWAWWTINGVILVQFLVGWYGNRKTKKQDSS